MVTHHATVRLDASPGLKQNGLALSLRSSPCLTSKTKSIGSTYCYHYVLVTPTQPCLGQVARSQYNLRAIEFLLVSQSGRRYGDPC